MHRLRTKIIATVSDRNCEIDFIRNLYSAGMNVVRINTAHQTPDESRRLVENIRAVSDHIGILLDTKGPEVRTWGMDKDVILAEGETVQLGEEGDDTATIQLNASGIFDAVPIGAAVLIDDGETALQVTGKESGRLLCIATHDCKIKNKKSVNIPGVHLDLPVFGPRDEAYIHFACEMDLDFIAHSFVRSKADVLAVQALLDAHGSSAKIIAKIENQEGVDNLEEILTVAYGIMIARGDLGIEIPAEQVPAIQKRMIETCISRARPVITATQMLHSMIENPRPTRAEVSDVANAVFDGTDALMLSGETAYGKYPLEAVQTMARIACEAEEAPPPEHARPKIKGLGKTSNFIAKCAVRACKRLDVKAIVTDTETGLSARILASYRSRVPIYATTHDPHIMRELALSYGIRPALLSPMPESTDELLAQALTVLLEQGKFKEDDLLAIMAAAPNHYVGANLLEINTAADCIRIRRNGE